MINKLDLYKLLRDKNVHFDIHEHDPLYTVQDSEKLRGKIDGMHTKNLFLKNKKNKFFLLSCGENIPVNLKLFAKSIDAKNISFASADYLEKYLGVKPGSVSPYSLLNDSDNEVSFYFDENLAKSDVINFHPLINTVTISVKTSDFIKFIIENGKKINIFSLNSYTVINSL